MAVDVETFEPKEIVTSPKLNKLPNSITFLAAPPRKHYYMVNSQVGRTDRWIFPNCQEGKLYDTENAPLPTGAGAIRLLEPGLWHVIGQVTWSYSTVPHSQAFELVLQRYPAPDTSGAVGVAQNGASGSSEIYLKSGIQVSTIVQVPAGGTDVRLMTRQTRENAGDQTIYGAGTSAGAYVQAEYRTYIAAHWIGSVPTPPAAPFPGPYSIDPPGGDIPPDDGQGGGNVEK